MAIDFETMLKNSLAASRAEEMKNSSQLTLGELILKLQAVKNKELPIYLDHNELRPTSVGSWRGSYCELAISFTKEGVYDGYNGDKIIYESKYGNSYESIPTTLSENPTARELLELLERCKGKTFVGYKGGDFIMGKTTPVWISNYGCSSGLEREKDKYETYIIDVAELDEIVVLATKDDDY